MPKIRILDKNDFLQSFAVFLMMFLFIAIVCILAALVISYTRCQTIALNNRYIFDDLKRLGASPAFLKKEVRYQCGNVFKIPSIVGMSAIYLLYCMVMYANDGKLVSSEIYGLTVCLVTLFLIARTVRAICHQLGI